MKSADKKISDGKTTKVNYGAMAQSYEPEGEMIDEKRMFPPGFLDKHKNLDPSKNRDFQKLKQILRQDNKKGLAMTMEMNRYGKETGKATGSMNKPKGSPVKKGGSKDKALNFVRTKIRKETGKPEGQRKKSKGEKGRVQPGDRKGLDYKTRVANKRESQRTKNDAMMDTRGT